MLKNVNLYVCIEEKNNDFDKKEIQENLFYINSTLFNQKKGSLDELDIQRYNKRVDRF